MVKTTIAYLFLSLLISSTCAQEYFSQRLPLSTPEIFAPDIISFKDRSEFGSIFSKDGKEFYFAIDEDGKASILVKKFVENKWSSADTVLTHQTFSYNDPMLSPDQKRLYFISNQPINGIGESKDYDIWYVERTADGWSRLARLGLNINSNRNEYYISFNNEGDMFFASNIEADENRLHDYDIYKARFQKGDFLKAIKLPNTINTGRYEADVFIASDESYIIFSAAREDGFGKGDLYISTKDKDNNWQEAQNMGPNINNSGHQLCPFVTYDGKYLFYTSEQDIYWVSTSILENYK